MKCRMKASHAEYLLRMRFLPASTLQKIDEAQDAGHHRELVLETDELVEIEELCADRMPLVGFDKAYQPNEEGRLLEELIDWLYDELSKRTD